MAKYHPSPPQPFNRSSEKCIGGIVGDAYRSPNFDLDLIRDLLSDIKTIKSVKISQSYSQK